MSVRTKFKVVSVVDETGVDRATGKPYDMRGFGPDVQVPGVKAVVPNDMYTHGNVVGSAFSRKRVTLTTGYDRGIVEDVGFNKAIPEGVLELVVENPSAVDALLVGGYFYLELTPAPDLRPLAAAAAPPGRVSDPIAPAPVMLEPILSAPVIPSPGPFVEHA